MMTMLPPAEDWSATVTRPARSPGVARLYAMALPASRRTTVQDRASAAMVGGEDGPGLGLVRDGAGTGDPSPLPTHAPHSV